MAIARILALLVVAILVFVNQSGYCATRLNNMVIEYVDAANPAEREFAFEFDSPGWLFTRTYGGSAKAVIKLDGEQTLIQHGEGVPTTQESMRFVAAGRHVVEIVDGAVERLQVRRVPEIRYCRFQYDPWVYQEGPFDWAFLEKHMLPHVNTIVGSEGVDQSRFADSWRKSGKRWIIEVLAPGIQSEQKQPVTEKFVYEGLTAGVQLERPWLDGVLVDEYVAGHKRLFAPTLAAVRRIHSDPKFASKRLELYVSGSADRIGAFVCDSIAAGATVALECYNPEQPTEQDARKYLERRLSGAMSEYVQLRPDIAGKMVVALGIYSTPPETLDVYPAVDDRVYRDMEFHILANDPAFAGLGGVMTYTSGYAGEEAIRWVGKLYRHYCIEGRTERLSHDPYQLPFVKNGDFVDGLAGWKVEPAEPNSITVRHVTNLGDLEGRYNAEGVGDDCLVMRRAAERPNAVRQKIEPLKAGTVYTLQMFSWDLNQGRAQYGNPTMDDVSGINIAIDGAEWIDEGCFDHHYRSIHTKKPMFFNYHVRRFRARQPIAELTIGDWVDRDQRSGNIGRETGINFVQVRPYLEVEND